MCMPLFLRLAIGTVNYLWTARLTLILYRTKEFNIRKGWLFSTNTSAMISLFQVIQPPNGTISQPQHSSRWHIEVTNVVTPSQHQNIQVPVTNSLQDSARQVTSIAILMKGLVDLKPPEY
jgi:hypothetical protein